MRHLRQRGVHGIDYLQSTVNVSLDNRPLCVDRGAQAAIPSSPEIKTDVRDLQILGAMIFHHNFPEVCPVVYQWAVNMDLPRVEST